MLLGSVYQTFVNAYQRGPEPWLQAQFFTITHCTMR
jgi:hypothetical protein